MQRSAILGLLLACAASLGICTVILEDGMPILWAQTASQLTDLPSQNGVVTPNPWNYLHRLSMLRLLIAATDPYMGSMGTNATDSPVWGLPLQLAWMLTSGESWGKKLPNGNNLSMLRWFEFCDGNKCNMWILQDVSSTQLEPQPAASRQKILCVYPLRAGGAVSTTKAERHFKKTLHSKLLFFSSPKLTAGINYFPSALPFLSAAKEGFLGAVVEVLLKLKTCK